GGLCGAGASVAGWLGRIWPLPSARPAASGEASPAMSLYESEVSFLREALQEAYRDPGAPAAPGGTGGVGWREYGPQSIVEFVPPPDLRQRLEVLPQTYLAERKVMAKFKLATSKARGKALLGKRPAGGAGTE